MRKFITIALLLAACGADAEVLLPRAKGGGATINAKADCGLAGNGVADETATLQRCLDQYPNSRFTFVAGIYRLTAALTIQRQTIEGVGVGSYDIASTNPVTTLGATVFTIEGAVATAFSLNGNGGEIRDLVVMHTGAVAAGSGALIKLYTGSSKARTIERVVLTSSATSTGAWDGIAVDGLFGGHSTGTRIRDVSVYGLIGTAGIRVQYGESVVIDGYRYLGYPGTHLANGIDVLYGSQNTKILNSDIQGASDGIRLYASALSYTNGPRDTQITNTRVSGCGNIGINISYAIRTSLTNVRVLDTNSAATRGIYVYQSVQTTITGGEASHNPTGIQIAGGSQHTAITGMNIAENLNYGINTVGAVTHLIIQGNMIHGGMYAGLVGSGYPNVATPTCIAINPAATDYYIIVDNLIGGCATLINDGGTGLTKNVSNNY